MVVHLRLTATLLLFSKADCCYFVTEATPPPWAAILSWCNPPKPVDFTHVIEEK